MCRISPIDPKAASAVRKDVLDAVEAKFGMVPMMVRTMAQSPAVVAGWAALDGALDQGVLGARTFELIALAVAQANSSAYCLARHAAIGELIGLTPEEIVEARRGRAAEPKESAAIHLALEIVEARGAVSDEVLCLSREAGLSDPEITEVLAHVALNVFTNYFTRLADPEIDFPRIDARLMDPTT